MYACFYACVIILYFINCVYFNSIYVCFNSIYVCFNSIYVCFNSIYACFNSIYVCFNSIYTMYMFILYVNVNFLIPTYCMVYGINKTFKLVTHIYYLFEYSAPK